MPTLFRLLLIIGLFAGVVFAALYVLATRFEPEQREETKVVPGVTIPKE